MKPGEIKVSTEFNMKYAGKVVLEIDYKNKEMVLRVEDEYIDITGEELLFIVGMLQATIEFMVTSAKKLNSELPEGKQMLN